jgi:hypothetical protein
MAAEHPAERSRLRELVSAARLETTLVAAGAGAVVLHVLDDSFFQREPGTSAGDHLVGALVPAALFTGAAIAYPRLRAGARAALAITLGLLGLVIGAVEPVVYGPKEGLSGDDFTGLLAALGGLALVGTGTVTAWRSRRRDDRRAWRYSRRLLLGVGAALGISVVLFPLALSYGFTHVARVETPRGDLGAPYAHVSFKASDGLRLDGWFVRPKNGATVIVYPGKKGTQRHARMLVRHGFGVLVFDRRGEGASEGDPNALGWSFDRDLLGALTYLRSRDDVDPGHIGGLGLSVGGEALLQTAAESTALGAVVSDGAGSRSIREDTIHVHARKLSDVVVSAVITAGTALFSNRLPPPSLKTLAGRITAPVFFV